MEGIHILALCFWYKYPR